MSTHPLTTTQDTPPVTASRSGRAAGAAGLATLATYAAAVLIAPKQDLTNRAQLQAFLEDNGRWQALAWLLMLVTGLCWLLFVVGLRRLLPGSPGRDLFAAAAIVGQAATWVGASLNTAAAPPDARDIPLPVYQAFGEAGHLAIAAGTAATGLALLGLARATGKSRLWSTSISRGTTLAGALLILTAVIGPVSIPVYTLWLLTISILLLRGNHTNPNTAGQRA
jgi:hypothetical protein